ncbi:MAG: DUF4279 domain-containing protein [Verrucomicrobiia bacterium]|jgi:hypothetical protein
MAISDFSASTIIEVRANFGFWQFDCDPNKISASLNITADEIWRKGEKRRLRDGKETENRWNSWHIRSKGNSKDANDHLRELLTRLKGKENLVAQEFGKPSFSVLWKGNYLYAGSGPSYESDVLKGIALFGADLWQDIYQIDQSDDEIENKSGFKRIPK